MTYLEFPSEGFWVVKWIDGYRKNLHATNSTTVEVTLQRLAPAVVEDLLTGTLSPASIFGGPSTQQRKAGAKAPDLFTVPQFVGSLPDLHPGYLFHKQELYGKIPTATYSLDLPNGELGCEKVLIGDNKLLDPDSGDETRTHVLNNFQYALHPDAMAYQALVHYQGDIEFVIPRQVIFQTFYAVHREMANAFCNGPWGATAKDVIDFESKKNGLKTQRLEESKQWHVIVKTLIQNEYARLLALLWFDDDARKRANSIYAEQLRDTETFGKRHGHRTTGAMWRCSAKLPYREDYPVQLAVEGYELTPWSRSKQVYRKVLVTRILEAPWPDYAWRIGYERENSGKQGLLNKPAEKFGGPRGGPRKRDGSKVPPTTAKVEPNPRGVNYHSAQERFAWSGRCEIFELIKSSSEGVEKRVGARPPEPQGVASSGNPGGGSQGVDQHSPRVQKVEVPERFKEIAQALLGLEPTVKSVIVGPPALDLREDRGAYSCWNFLTLGERSRADLRPWYGWRLLMRGTRDIPGLLRAALIIGVVCEGRHSLLIEIESRPRGASFCGVILVGAPRSESLILDALAAIAEAEGVKLADALASLEKSYGCRIHTYHHETVDDEVDGQAVKRFNEEAFRRSCLKALRKTGATEP